VRTDVTSWSDLRRLFDAAVAAHGRVDHVFANAGVGSSVDYLRSRYDHDDDGGGGGGGLREPDARTWDVNLRGMVNTAYLALHWFRTQDPPGGSVVCTGSASSFQPFTEVDYSASKHGILGWVRGVVAAIEAAKLPIRVNTIGPSVSHGGKMLEFGGFDLGSW
jgi:NAD(P)-dependent dehydrogenase (short-subunit alcohol dehydrogenase family)